jgi:hypothetical protein
VISRHPTTCENVIKKRFMQGLAPGYCYFDPMGLTLRPITIHDQSVWTTFDLRKALPTIVLRHVSSCRQWLTGELHTVLIEAKHG